jgi:hypothetical protein
MSLLKLEKLALSRLQNLAFGDLIKSHLAGIAKLPADIFTDAILKAKITALTQKSAAYDKGLVKIAMNEQSKQLEDLDAVRDGSLSNLAKGIKMATPNVAAEMEASRVLSAVIGAYPGLAEREYSIESNGIDNLISDLESDRYKGYVATLVLARFVAQLKKSNAAFRAVFDNRQFANATREYIDSKALRKDLHECYQDFCLYLLAMANNSTSKQYLKTLDIINTDRKYFANKLAQSEGVAAANAKKDDVTAL